MSVETIDNSVSPIVGNIPVRAFTRELLRDAVEVIERAWEPYGGLTDALREHNVEPLVKYLEWLAEDLCTLPPHAELEAMIRTELAGVA